MGDLQYEHRFLTGFAEEEIVGLADRENVDLIVMGSHGRTGLYRMLMGSIAEGVLRKAHCPVLIVKQPMTAEGATATEESVKNESQ